MANGRVKGHRNAQNRPCSIKTRFWRKTQVTRKKLGIRPTKDGRHEQAKDGRHGSQNDNQEAKLHQNRPLCRTTGKEIL